MILTYPYCHGENARRRHPLTPMRVERTHEAALPNLRCPECHDSRPYSTSEPLDNLAMRDEHAAIVSREVVEDLREKWSPPVLLRFRPTGEHRLVEIECRRVTL